MDQSIRPRTPADPPVDGTPVNVFELAAQRLEGRAAVARDILAGLDRIEREDQQKADKLTREEMQRRSTQEHYERRGGA